MSMLFCRRRVMRFLLARAIASALYYPVYIWMVESGMHYLIASVSGFFLYWLVNYFFTKRWTNSSSVGVRRQAFHHLLLHSGNQALVLIGLYIQIDIFGVHYIVAQIILSCVLTVETYVVSSIIFKDQ